MRSLLPWLELSRRFLPLSVWERIEDSFWEAHWQREGQSLGNDIAVAPALEQAGVAVFDSLKDRGLRGSERTVLVESISRLYPFKSILEIGCGYGQSLHILAPLFPKVRFFGVDIALDRISSGNELLRNTGISNAEMFHGTMERLSTFPDKSVDFVFSCASLLYISAEKIEAVLTEATRVATKGLLLMEQIAKIGDDVEEGSIEYGFLVPATGRSPSYWHRDYLKLCKRIFGAECVRLVPIPNPRFQTEQWQSSAALLVITF